MFTTFDKAIAAVVGGLVSFLALTGLPVPEFMADPAWVASISSAVAGFMTYFVPNKD